MLLIYFERSSNGVCSIAITVDTAVRVPVVGCCTRAAYLSVSDVRRARSSHPREPPLCVDPPLADREELSNASDVRGAVALVVRGGCSFAQKARRIQAAGAIAVILANNVRGELFAAFTMGESKDEAASGNQDAAIMIPCVMMCLYDVRELFKQCPPSVQTGVMTLEITDAAKSGVGQIVQECELQRQLAIQQHGSSGDSNSGAGGGWGVTKRKTPSIMKLLDPQALSKTQNQNSLRVIPQQVADPATADANQLGNDARAVRGNPTADSTPAPAIQLPNEESKMAAKSPLFAFVQWSSDASFYQYHCAPLSDFCLAGNNTIYESKLVVCDPILADEPLLRNAHDLPNAIMLVKRGACAFPTKLERIQRCGAVAAIVGNDDVKNPDAAFVMSVDKIKADRVTIPSLMVSRNIFEQLVAEKVSYVRILCFSGESAAAFMLNAGNLISLTEVPLPSGTGESEEDDMLRRFHEACRQGDHGGCQRILDENCRGDPEKRELVKRIDVHHLMSLHHACVSGNEHVVDLLIRLGASVDAMDIAMQTPLHVACLHGHSSCVRRLAQAGTVQPAVGDIGSMTTKQNIGGSTPLHYAAAAGSTDCLEILLTANARVDVDGKYLFGGVSVVDNDGATPLHIACRSTHADCSMYLIAANADLDAVDRSGYTPLRICCEMANEPEFESASLHVIEKLVLAGAIMQERHDKQGVVDSNGLFLDHIESKTVKRELEAMYLRHEVQLSQRRFESSQQENSTLKAQISQLQIEVKHLAEQNALALKTDAVRTSSNQTQQVQIDQLHVQMKTILQLLQSQNEGAAIASVPFHAARANPLPGSSSTTSTVSTACGPDEETLAQEAALARDLGKKFCRKKKFTVAEMYFEKSFELFPLPGKSSVAFCVSEKRNLGKSKLIEEFRKSLAKSNAPNHVRQSIEREVSKSDSLQEGSSEFEMVQKWIEWLVVLPWGDPFSGLQNAELYLSNPDIPQQTHALEEEERRHHLDVVARTIQRAFREHYSGHMLRRSIASVCIQSAVRGFLARRTKRVLLQQRYYDESQRGRSGNSAGDKTDMLENVIVPPVDYSSRVDPAALTRLRCKNSKVVAGVHFAQAPHDLRPKLHFPSGSPFHVLQLLRAKPTGKMDLYGALTISTGTSSDLCFVWSRWGEDSTNSKSFQCVLSGPYEQLGPAQQRYERIFREQHQKRFVITPPLIEDSPAWPLCFSDKTSGAQDSPASRIQLSTLST